MYPSLFLSLHIRINLFVALHLVIPDHRRVLLRQRLAVLQLVNTLSSVALLELVSDYTSLHSLNP